MKSSLDQPLLESFERVRQSLESNQENLEKYLQILKLASVGEMVGEISHTFNNILGGILGYSQLLKAELPDDSDAHRQAQVIEKGSKRASRLISQLQFYSQKRKNQRSIADPKQIVEEVQLILQSTFKNITIRRKINHGSARISVDVPSIYQVLLNIGRNCKDAMDDGGEINIQTEMESGSGKKQFVVFEISDTGSGIKKEILPHIFEPFFSTKKTGIATGMGLAIAEAIVKSHHGRIEVESEIGRGSVFRVLLPVARRKSLSVINRRDRADKIKHCNGELIMVVDDEEDLREMAKRIFEKRGFKVVLAGSGQNAMEVLEQHGKEIKLVILDMILPEGDGAQVYDKIKKSNSGSKVILTSGYVNDAPFQELLDHEHFLPKPWDLPELIEEAERILEAV